MVSDHFLLVPVEKREMNVSLGKVKPLVKKATKESRTKILVLSQIRRSNIIINVRSV